jgi:hypothetical protein
MDTSEGNLLAISEGAAAFGAIDFGTWSRPILLVERDIFDYGTAMRKNAYFA